MAWFKRNGERIPSLKEIIDNLMEYHLRYMSAKMENMDEGQKKRFNKFRENL